MEASAAIVGRRLVGIVLVAALLCLAGAATAAPALALGTPPQSCFAGLGVPGRCPTNNPDPPRYMAGTYLGELHDSPHTVKVGDVVTSTVDPNGPFFGVTTTVGWHPPGKKLNCPGSAAVAIYTCTWKVTSGTAGALAGGYEGGWSVDQETLCSAAGCAPSGDYMHVVPEACPFSLHGTRRTGNARVATASCDPTLKLHAADPTPINAVSATPFDLRATVLTGDRPLQAAAVTARLEPAFVVKGSRSPRAALGRVPRRSSRTVALPGAKLRPTVVRDAHTLSVQGWPGAGWRGPAQPAPTFGGGYLVYSDYPEYVADSTQVAPGVTGGARGEGVLYAEQGSTFAARFGRPHFRVYFNHENRTNVGKEICVVLSAPGPGETVAETAEGIAENTGDPVGAGRAALSAYERSRRAGQGSSIAISTTISQPGQPARVIPVTALCPKSTALPAADGNGNPVVNGILDFTDTGLLGVQVAVVVLDQSDVKRFSADPVDYRFADKAHPKGNPARTLATGTPLLNPDESGGHTRGTFPYDTLSMTLDSYDVDAGRPWGTLIAGTPSKTPEDADEYEPAIDTGSYDYGNYGVFYDVTIPTTGTHPEAAQALLNPRGVGHFDKVTNAFAGVVDVPAGAGGHLGQPMTIPAASQPGTNARADVIDHNYAVGIGRVKAGDSFSFELMPAAGSTFPLGVVLVPAFVKASGTLSYRGGSVTSAPDPNIIPLVPK